MNNALYIRRRNRLFLEPGRDELPENYVAALLKNIEPLGYTFGETLIENLRTQSLDALTALYRETVAALRELTGAHRKFRPLYPNFPEQVLEMSEARLYLNAILHYLTNRLPNFEKKERLPLLDETNLKVIELGTIADFETIFTRLAGSNASLSAADKDDLKWFVENYRDDIFRLLPDEIPQKENLAFIGAQLLANTETAEDFLKKQLKTATDVLRLAAALSDGDVSLAKATKFRSFKRSERRALLGLLNGCGNLPEDFRRWKKRWLRLGERLHAGEFATRFPRAFEAFDAVRNDRPADIFNGRIERALTEKDAAAVAALLASRPGDFARRLDHLLRLDAARADATLAAFSERAAQVSTPVLLQVKTHFEHRDGRPEMRVFFPKGDLAKVFAAEDTRPALDEKICARAAAICRRALLERFAERPPLGRCYLDERLKNYLVPFSQRSASKALRTLVRGSRLELPDAPVIRFFLWWKNGRERTDIDLSAVFYDENLVYQDTVSYYNLKNYGGHHSGDIVDAPHGAAEFIDIDLARTVGMGVRYVVLSLNSFTQQPYCDLPECFAGWMARSRAGSGEIFEPKTVVDRIDLAADTRICLPLIADLHEKRLVWTDIALKKAPRWNNVEQNLRGVSLMAKAMTNLVKTDLFELFALHIAARGAPTAAIDEADTVFSVEKGITPFDLDIIASEFL